MQQANPFGEVTQDAEAHLDEQGSPRTLHWMINVVPRLPKPRMTYECK